MGWCSGTDIYERVAKTLDEYVDKNDPEAYHECKLDVLDALVEVLTDHDWDCVDEAFGVSSAGDEVLTRKGYGQIEDFD